ncbi:MAG TPA: xanthine dehydrogenase family protein molybdopterin-binding subunit [Terriglobia bacterium]|nr:xanthine dehydrogenase family protein molybdopterin-binding subunit [Terriglobia bacterium]
MSTVENLSRREFVKGMFSAGALVLCGQVAPIRLWAGAVGTYNDPVAAAPFHPNVWLGIEPDGAVTIVASRSEMGSGSRTGPAIVLADELEADWKRVRIEQAIGDAKYGGQDTDGSHSIRDLFDVMRQAGAAARTMLEQAAAQQWNVPVSECKASLHTVAHQPTGRTLGYGELASAAAKLPVPPKESLTFKPRSSWRYIGKETSLIDLHDIATGKAGYGMDAHLEGMLYASVEHPPVLGGTVKSFDDKEALKLPGVRMTLSIDPFKPPHVFQPLGGVAVLADNTWAAFQGRQKLKIEWENGPNSSYNSMEYRKELEATAQKPGKVVRNVGDVDAEFAKGGRIIEAAYYTPHLAHASMEPPVALADYRNGKVVAWTCTQNPQEVQTTVANVLGLKPADVTCHVTLLGGGFGRKSKPDYVAEAAVLSKKAGRPVKVVWSREDDIKFDYYHSVAAMYMKAAVGADGLPTAWLQRSVFPPIASTFAIGATYGDAGEMGLGWSDLPYAIPNHRAENGPATAHVRIGWLRSVANVYHSFAINCFADELAHAAGRDALEYRLALLGPDRIVDRKSLPENFPNYDGSYAQYPIDTSRMRQVMQLAAEKAAWGKRPLGKGEGMGIALHRSFLTYVATVVRVEVNGEGKLRIRQVDTALDAGTLVNRDTVRNQFEGAAIFGTSLALHGEITASGGMIEQSNFADYPVCRIDEAPEKINIHIVESEAPPAGVGEPGLPPFAPALCNAIFAATGKRVRELPLSKTNLA